jgi:hypothetical protein
VSTARARLDASAALGATQVAVKVCTFGGKWREARPIRTENERVWAAEWLNGLYADPENQVEEWCFHLRADGETVYVEPLAHQWQVTHPEFGADPLPERFVIAHGGDRVEVTL